MREKRMRITMSKMNDDFYKFTFLSARRRRICFLAALGLDNLDIATNMGISEAAVKKQLTEIYKRLQIPSIIFHKRSLMVFKYWNAK